MEIDFLERFCSNEFQKTDEEIIMAASGGNEPEWLIRKKRIDPRLDALGWKLPEEGITHLHASYRSEEHLTDHGPADYALHLGNKAVGVVEAKKLTIGTHNILTGYRMPFQYSTNGKEIWLYDKGNYKMVF